MNKFVFVVCGARQHIDTLHFSLRALRHFSANEIIVITDSSRNEIPVKHDYVIDVPAPPYLNNHQAAIFLKTSLNKYLPAANDYCYLDTDVVALSNECDTIFNHKNGIITFGADFCRLPRFSPAAIKCSCFADNEREKQELQTLIAKYDEGSTITDSVILSKRDNLNRKLELIKRNRFTYLLYLLRYFTATKTFKLDEDNFYHPKQKAWFDKENRLIRNSASKIVKTVEQNSQWRWNMFTRRWISPTRKDVNNLSCNHLAEAIESRFGIKVPDRNFQHWNGGVFLFNDASKPFLEWWHEKTISAFTYPEWQTRDQGTLLATTWQFGLQNQPVLPKKYNFIAHWDNKLVMVDGQGYFSEDGFRTKLKPAFAHIYRNFGKKGWPIWDYIEDLNSQIEAA